MGNKCNIINRSEREHLVPAESSRVAVGAAIIVTAIAIVLVMLFIVYSVQKGEATTKLVFYTYKTRIYELNYFTLQNSGLRSPPHDMGTVCLL